MLRRAVALIVSPEREWGNIAAERSRPLALLLRYVLPLSAAPAVAWMIGLRVFGLDFAAAGEVVRFPAWPAVLHAGLVTFLGAVGSVAVLAAAFALIAPMYGVRRDLPAAWTVAAYGSTPFWAFGLLLVKPGLVIAALVAVLHASYLYYAGLQAVAGVKEGDAAEYVAIGLFLLLAVSTLAGGALASLGWL